MAVRGRRLRSRSARLTGWKLKKCLAGQPCKRDPTSANLTGLYFGRGYKPASKTRVGSSVKSAFLRGEMSSIPGLSSTKGRRPNWEELRKEVGLIMVSNYESKECIVAKKF